MLQRIDFGIVARELLKGGRYTTASLAVEVGLSQPSISRIATGQTKSISGDVAIKLILLAGGTVSVPFECSAAANEALQA